MRWTQKAAAAAQQALDWAAQLRPSAHVPVYHDADYRLPLTSVQGRTGFEPRRPDLVLWYLQDHHLLPDGCLYAAPRIAYAELELVHTSRWLDALGRPEALAQVFGLPEWDIDVGALLGSVRAACGGTLEATRRALRRGGPVLNLAGGFHHAKPDGGGGFCALNDLAVALAVVRREGFAGSVAVLDLDAHPPDGTAACWRRLGEAGWIGSLSGSDWGQLPGVDETVLPDRADDATYLAALDALLGRMPRADLTFVVAGGDVLASDPLGRLGMSLPGVAERDLRVARVLEGRASVWLPAGGYSDEAWKVLLGTAHVLLRDRPPSLRAMTDPLARRFRKTSAALKADLLGDWTEDAADIERSMGLRRDEERRFLGFYTAEGLEYALSRYGVLHHLQALGYRDLRVELDRTDVGERMRLFGRFDAASAQPVGPERHVLVECVLEVQPLPDSVAELLRQRRDAALPVLPKVLFVHWLTLRHPRGAFAAARPRLPGQEVPGLGMAREAGELLARIAERLGLVGVALRPAWFHVAFAARYRMRFVDPALQGQFLALVRDLLATPSLRSAGGDFCLVQASRAVAERRVLRQEPDGTLRPWQWQAELMVDALGDAEPDPAVLAARDTCHFVLAAGEAELPVRTEADAPSGGLDD